MKKIGLMGGLGPASTVEYYMKLNELYKEKFGEKVYPKIVIDSVDMSVHTKAFNEHDYKTIGDYIYNSLMQLKNAGAELAGITANTEHIAWDYIKDRLPLPTISIVDATIKRIKQSGYKKVVVFATQWTLDSGLYDKALYDAGISAVIPCACDRSILGKLIYPNLENGIVIQEDKEKMLALARKYIRQNRADALLLGCTEIPLMLQPQDVDVPLINTTQIHIEALYKLSTAQ